MTIHLILPITLFDFLKLYALLEQEEGFNNSDELISTFPAKFEKRSLDNNMGTGGAC